MLENSKDKAMIADFLRSRFWGQFIFGDLFNWGTYKEISRRIDEEIAKLVVEFEGNAAQMPNKLMRELGPNWRSGNRKSRCTR